MQKKLIENLQKNRYAVSVFASAAEAADYLDRVIDGKSVGFGDSQTLAAMDLFARLSRHNRVTDPQNAPEGMDFLRTAKRSLDTEIYLTSVNAVAETGEMVNLDGTGNRVAGSLFGHEKVYFVVGCNKVMPTLSDAVDRVRNVAAPRNAMRLNKRTPCAVRGDRCYDCASPDRICNGLMIHYKKMSNMDMEIVLIDEPLGL